MNAKAVWEQILQVSVTNRFCFGSKELTTARITSEYLTNSLFFQSFVSDISCSLGRFFPRMHEDDCLIIILANMLENFDISDIIHGFKLFDSLLFGNANELLTKRARPEGAIKMEHPFQRVYSQETRNISIVGQ